MATLQEYRWRVVGVDCPLCAAEIERALTELTDVRSARINLSAGEVTILAESADEAELMTRCQTTGQRLEASFRLGRHSVAAPTWRERLRSPQNSCLLVALFCFFLSFATTGNRAVALQAAAWLLAGWPVLLAAVRILRRGGFCNEFALMSVATLGAWALGEGTEAAAVMVFYQAGEFLQSIAVSRSKRDIAALMDIRPDQARRLDDSGETTIVAPETLSPGDRFVVLPGEKIPLDGLVEDGASSLDTSGLTGEPLPVDISSGAAVTGGTLNLSGRLVIRATSAFGQSTVARVLRMVQEASNRKAHLERFVSRFAHWYTPIIFAAAFLVGTVPPLILLANWSTWFYRALVFLVISCPCALVISVPLTFFAGLGALSRHGIVVKGGNWIEVLARARAVVFDKTGTLTTGQPHVVSVRSAPGVTDDRLIQIAATLEANSTHPIARAVLRAAADRGLPPLKSQEAHELPGRGLTARFESAGWFCGNTAFMEERGVELPESTDNRGVIHVAQEGRWVGTLYVADKIKSDAIPGLTALRTLGTRFIALVTGDGEEVARNVATKLELDAHASELLPHEKVTALERYRPQAEHGTLLFVGDGINDAPVLAAADLGIAMGGLGSEAAIEAADAVIMSDRIVPLADAIAVARHTVNIVRTNVVFALGVKAAVVALDLFGLADLWMAVFADVGVTLLAVANALSVLRWCPHHHRECTCVHNPD